MPYPPIPTEIWKAIGQAPTLRLDANQWGERGYVLVDGVVHHYCIDRKEQFDELMQSWPVASFVVGGEPEEVRAFFRAHLGG